MTAQTSIGANDGRIQSTVVAAETGPFAIDFPFFDLDDIVVTITNTDGVIYAYVRGVDYDITATANDDGIYPSGTVTWLGAGTPVAGILSRYRMTGLERSSQLPLTGYLDRTALNADLDRVMCAMQDFERRLVNALRYPEEDGALETILVPAAQRANMAALFDADGQLYAGAGVADVTASAFMLTVLDDTTAGAVRTTIGAVGLTGNETVAGNKTFSGAVTFGALPSLIERVQSFTTTGTYTPHANMVYCRIEAVGGGGGGGGTATAAATVGAGGGGGGAGSCTSLVATAAAIGASKAVTIGAAGTAGTAGNNAGGDGGDSSVGSLCIGKGGKGGAGCNGSNAALGGLAGVAGTGDETQPGMSGLPGMIFVSANEGVSGTGGSSRFGSGGLAKLSTTAAAGNAGTGKGSGGSGGASFNAGGTAAGGAGTAGFVIIREFCWA